MTTPRRSLRRMLVLLFAALALAGACATTPAPDIEPPATPGRASGPDTAGIFKNPCRPHPSPMSAPDNGVAAFREAACLAERLGRHLDAETRSAYRARLDALTVRLVRDAPESGAAHYLRAIALGYLAENDPVGALRKVPMIEAEARHAAGLAPHIDRAGPYRVLGELYLEAPDPPLSIGDLDKALEAWREAVRIAPDHGPNRLGLARALKADEQVGEACRQIAGILKSLEKDSDTRGRAGDLLRELCRTMAP